MEIGQALTLQLLEEKESKRNESFSSKIIEQNQQMFYIAYPINNKTGRTSIFLEGTSFKISYIGEGNAVYSFTSEVIARRKINKIPVLELRQPLEGDLNKIQRRNYLRIEAYLDISINFLNNSDSRNFTTTTVDISGGGSAIVVPNGVQIEPEQLLKVWIVLPFKTMPYQYIEANAKVIRLIEKDNGPTLASLEFVSINNHDRDLVIRYCLMKQLEKKR